MAKLSIDLKMPNNLDRLLRGLVIPMRLSKGDIIRRLITDSLTSLETDKSFVLKDVPPVEEIEGIHAGMLYLPVEQDEVLHKLEKKLRITRETIVNRLVVTALHDEKNPMRKLFQPRDWKYLGLPHNETSPGS